MRNNIDVNSMIKYLKPSDTQSLTDPSILTSNQDTQIVSSF